MTAERFLVLMLRGSAVILLLAVVPVLMPYRWSQDAHEWLGLGTLPHLPIIEYLIRSVSMLYASLGVLSWAIANDVRRYRPLVVLGAWFHIVFGIGILAIDAWVALPWWWIIIEGPSLIGAGFLMLFLVRRVPA